MRWGKVAIFAVEVTYVSPKRCNN